MKIGIIGLGRMGLNMAHRLIDHGHQVVAYNRTYAKVEEAMALGAEGARSVQELVEKLEGPRAIWVMVPAGQPVDDMIAEITRYTGPGDIIVDGGNSNFHDSMRRASDLTQRGYEFIDCGTSGGIWGLQVGYCLMIGGNKAPVERLTPIFEALAPPNGFLHCGGHGAGHYVKMVHNGIEYGMLQAYAEGFEILEASQFPLDLHAVSKLWNQGSVVRSWLLELAERAFEDDPHLEGLSGYVEDSGEGRWTVQEAIDLDVPAPVITLSLLTRFRSRQPDSFGGRVIAALRNQFGGHRVQKSEAAAGADAGSGH